MTDPAEPPAPRPAMPRWVKAFIVVGIVVAVLAVVSLFTGGHGPGRHGSGHGRAPVASFAR